MPRKILILSPPGLEGSVITSVQRDILIGLLTPVVEVTSTPFSQCAWSKAVQNKQQQRVINQHPFCSQAPVLFYSVGHNVFLWILLNNPVVIWETLLCVTLQPFSHARHG